MKTKLFTILTITILSFVACQKTTTKESTSKPKRIESTTQNSSVSVSPASIFFNKIIEKYAAFDLLSRSPESIESEKYPIAFVESTKNENQWIFKVVEDTTQFIKNGSLNFSSQYQNVKEGWIIEYFRIDFQDNFELSFDSCVSIIKTLIDDVKDNPTAGSQAIAWDTKGYDGSFYVDTNDNNSLKLVIQIHAETDNFEP